MNWYKKTEVNGGKRLNLARVKKRLLEIRANPKSAYYKHYKAGRIAVIYNPRRASGHYDIVYLTPMEPDPSVMATCAECFELYLNIEEDYLCPECRAKADT